MGTSVGWIAVYVIGGFVVVSVAAGIVTRMLVKRGIRVPFAVRFVNRTSERAVVVIKRPITIAVLDEVADVLKAGHYTQSLAAALEENHPQLKRMIAEKIKADPTAGRVGFLPFHDRLVDEITETALRVLLAVLADPRTDELVSDLVRDTLSQIRQSVRARLDAEVSL